MRILREVDNDTVQKGWQCPKCHNIVSPHYKVCPKCEKEVKESTKDDRQIIIE
jgi:RNA polymerase subunit RPABC4/transcription elongation factor Spt4